MTGADTMGQHSGHIRVASANPYDVTICRSIEPSAAAIRAALGEAPSTVLILHQPALRDRVIQLRDLLEGGDQGARALRTVLHELPDAEEGKTLHAAGRAWAACAEAGLTRADAILSVGGGAATDVAGFIAATWMRGIRVVHYPTTLLAMVDAAVGGKTGINTEAGKNLVGSFHEPAGVIVDLEVLRTLPRAELVAGSAEIIKAGFIADTEILSLVEADPAAAVDPEGALPELIRRSIQVKADVVGQDLKESHLREILNYGHTYGHAVEHQENYRWRHGHAVAVGMVFEAELAHAVGLLSRSEVQRHRGILASVGLPIAYGGADLDTLIDVMGRDKKNRGSDIRFVVLEGIGRPTRLAGPDWAALQAAYAATQPRGAE
ncbi:3-dehydroquinate synthase [Corynebacterium heidelbergense]|uniref:3-dehydroquinate synthase n=1 Tax=Corynebacterium heidelbergense TaxID=2055947 RepID=A0A364VBT8_9CORY|nr:3-dehydroquinate synthase [Corynebacterium heidelbergense]RAV34084.1 3-dehydroquinate synthase [Corynebacterium heidelbergense]WCZ36610.1 3-dehydroquinate synthase [Corynebacterium heidelbergense]